MRSINRKEIKLFLFDLEGVLVPKNISDDSPLLPAQINCIKQFFEKLSDRGFYSGIVTMRSQDQLVSCLKEIPNCIVVTSMIDKVTPVEKILAGMNLEFKNLFYIGDDMFDIPLLGRAGISASPSNAHKEVKRTVDFVIPYAIIENLFNYILKEIIEKE